MSSPRENSGGELTQEAADRLADAFAQSMLALANGDQDGKDAEVAKMRHILDNQNGRGPCP